MYLSKAKIEELIKVAAEHDGHCDRCLRVIKVYKYPVSRTMAKIMREMAKATKSNKRAGVEKPREIDMETIGLTHTERSQLSKMRQHGLVVQPKDERGVKKPRHWLITAKGWSFLGTQPIPAKVIVFDNQVLGHEGGTTTIRRLLDDAGFYETDPLSTAEAAAYHDVRTPTKHIKHQAEYRGGETGGLEKGALYAILIERLQVGRPVRMRISLAGNAEPTIFTYDDIAAFQKNWRVIK